ncbi:MAG TPA: SusD/RagB family nutrient-binding outer membrane lipoprotein [Tenuifilaceae bacterium]|nr:SusD/RagB family nutrient-binding outer membrane lipoprotein [Tenuifilaceae bacterium]
MLTNRIINILQLISLILLLIIGGCTKDFEEINTNPNDIDWNKSHPDLLLTSAIEGLSDQIHDVWLGHEIGSCWVQHMAKVQYTDEDRYLPRNDVINFVWSNLYSGPGVEIQQIIEIAENDSVDNYKGVALVLKCYLFSVLTDLYGDIPYSEAFKIDSTLTPKYDTQESIYLDLISKLDYANTLLDANNEGIKGDILFNNSIGKWKKFANSLRLRLLLRMSDRMDYQSLVTNEFTNMLVTNSSDYPIFTANSDNAALRYLGSFPNNNPLNETYKTRDDHRLSNTMIDLLYKSSNHDHPDWRIVVYANTPSAGGFWVGLPNGLTSAKAAAYLGNGLGMTSAIGDYFVQPESEGMLMSYTELCFILAEAVERGFISGSTVTSQQYYERGITASYYQFQEPMTSLSPVYYPSIPTNTGVDTYLSDFLTHDGAWSATDPLKKIAEQKWVAMFDQGLQAWFEWRRTNIPQFTPAEDGLNYGKIPVRLRYPSDEYARNGAQLSDAVIRQGSDDLNTRVWWDVANNY